MTTSELAHAQVVLVGLRISNAPPPYRMLHSSNGACFWNIVVNLPCAWTRCRDVRCVAVLGFLLLLYLRLVIGNAGSCLVY